MLILSFLVIHNKGKQCDCCSRCSDLIWTASRTCVCRWHGYDTMNPHVMRHSAAQSYFTLYTTNFSFIFWKQLLIVIISRFIMSFCHYYLSLFLSFFLSISFNFSATFSLYFKLFIWYLYIILFRGHLIFWHIRGHCAIKTLCTFQN